MSNHNVDAVMAVLSHNGANAPNGWTKIQGQDLIARRVAWPDVQKLHLTNKKVVLVKVTQTNQGSSEPFVTEFEGNDAYAIEHDGASGRIRVARQTASGPGKGASRAEFQTGTETGGAGGGEQENWPDGGSQIPMLGVVMQDAAPDTSLLNAARAVSLSSVPLG